MSDDMLDHQGHRGMAGGDLMAAIAAGGGAGAEAPDHVPEPAAFSWTEGGAAARAEARRFAGDDDAAAQPE